MKIRATLFITTCFFSLLSAAQNIWVATSTSDATSESLDIVMDSEGNSYITGYISGDTEFQDIQIDITTGYSDVVVAKINPQGVYQWVKRFSGPMSDKGIKIALTSTNDLIVSGTFYSSITFGSTTLTSSAGSKDIFLLKLTNSGDVVWARKDGGALGDNIYALDLDQEDNIILSGQFEGSSTIGNQTFTSMTDPETDLPSFDMFLAKYDGNGTPVWSQAAYAEYEDRGIAVVCDNQNNIYLTGQFSDTIDFFGQTIYNQIYNAGFVAKFGPNGNRIWFDKLAAAQVLAYDITLNNQEQVLVTGDYLGQMVIWAQENQHILSNPYAKKIFVLKLSQNGNYIWGRAKGSDSEVSSRGICVDAQDNIYIGGHFRCSFDEYRDSTGTSHWQSAGFRDQFVTKFTTAGATVWKKHVGGQKEDQCWGIALHESDYPVITGSFEKNMVYPFVNGYNYSAAISNGPEQSYSPNLDITPDGVNHLLIQGDESINIHVSKMVHSNSSYYNYYEEYSSANYNDSLPMLINPDEDSVDFCPPDRACVATHTNDYYGPLYTGQWNTGTPWNLCVDQQNNDGLYSVYVDRLDGCYDFDDTIYIDYHPYPTMPLLTDDHDVNVNSANYNNIYACAPDTLSFHFENLCDGCTARISVPALGIQNAPLLIGFNYELWNASSIGVVVSSAYGCIQTDPFWFDLINDIDPYLLLNDSYDSNDSMMVCKGDTVQVLIADSITNPNRNLFYHGELVAQASVTILFNGTQIPATTNGLYSNFSPTETGWYVVNQSVTIGNDPCLFPHQVSDSFYVEVKENPPVSISGNELLCPDSYNYLTVSPVLPELIWFGPAILWTSADKDSIMLNDSGVYGVSGHYDYGEVTCPFLVNVLVQEKQPPLVLMSPADGIVCPGDSVLLYLDREGTAYEWIGPEGFPISFDSATYVTDQGFYACIFTDTSGCQLLTGQVEVREYSTPFIELSPSNVICEEEPITLTAVYGGMAGLQWQSPINSTAPSVVVTSPGTYSCQVTQCGMTVTASVTVIDGSYDLELTTESTSLCIGDTIRLQATPGLSVYHWSNGFVGLSFFEATEAGTYFVQTLNQYGCSVISDSITITAFPESYPPAINDTFVCVGGNIDLVYNSAFDFGWYHHPGDAAPFSTRDTISFTVLMADTVVYVAHNSVNCPLNFTEVLVEALLPLTPPEILGDTTVCVGDMAVFGVEPITNGSYFWIYDGDTISNTVSVTVPNISTDSPLTFHLVMTDGCTETGNSVVFSVKLPSPISISAASDTLCFGETLFATASGQGNVEFIWTDGSSTWNGANLAVNYSELYSGNLSVYGINGDGCESDILSLEVTLSPDANLGLSMDTLTCAGNALTLYATDTLGQISWTLPDQSVLPGYEVLIASLDQSNAGLYIAAVVNQFNCVITDSLQIEVHELPYFPFVNDSVLCSENAYDLYLPDLDFEFTWNSGVADPIFTPDGYTPVILSARDSIGCVFSDTVNIILVDCSGQAANVITTNGDGINEYFTIFNAEYAYDNCLIILNRWGNVVFEETYYRNTFNGHTNEGKKLNDGVYYFLYYHDCSTKKEITHQGFFHIISE